VTGRDELIDLKLFPPELNLFESESAWRINNRIAIVKEVDELLKKEKKLKEEEKKIKKEIEVLVDKTLELFELDKQQTKVKKKGKELKKALEQPFKDYNDVKKVLTIMDELLAKLPENEVEKFAKSEASKLYEKVMKKYG